MSPKQRAQALLMRHEGRTWSSIGKQLRARVPLPVRAEIEAAVEAERAAQQRQEVERTTQVVLSGRPALVIHVMQDARGVSLPRIGGAE